MKSLTEKLDRLLSERPAEIERAKGDGGRVLGYFCGYIPEEIVHAAGMIPLRLAQRGNNAVVSRGGSYLSPSSCPYACSCVGLKKANRDPYFKSVDCIADAPACMQMRRVAEVWERYFSVPTIPVAFPRKFYDKEGLEYFSKSLDIFIDKLGEIMGKPISNEALQESVKLYNRIRSHQRRLYEGLKEDNPPVPWEDILNIIRAGFVLDRKKYADFLEGIDTKNPAEPPQKPRLRLMVAGGMMAPGDDTLVSVLKDLGESFVMDELCSGSRGTYGIVTDASAEALARRYLGNVPCGSLPYPHRDNDPRHKHITRLIKEYRIDGFIYYTLRFCDAYSFKAKRLSKLVQDMGVPFIHLNSGYQESDEGQIRTRLEAFVETIRRKAA